MPRIAFDYDGVNKHCEETGDGSSTFDVCTDCFDLNESHDSRHLLQQLGGAYNGEPNPTDEEEVTHDDAGCENPGLYEGQEVHCECCGELLILNENY
jgi:hypothetical protein